MLGESQLPLPPTLTSICFRITRACNAQCDFCQAPPTDQSAPTLAQVDAVFQRLTAQRVRSVKLTGGEPTVRGDLSQIVTLAAGYGLSPTVCTNAVRLSEAVQTAIRDTATKVKVSLHAPDQEHDRWLGLEATSRVLTNIRRLRDNDVRVSIHTLITRQNYAVVQRMIDFCIVERITKISFLPFVPRGRGAETDTLYSVADIERRRLVERLRRLGVLYREVLDLRVLDFAAKDYYVIESDGRLTIQRDRDTTDITLGVLWNSQR